MSPEQAMGRPLGPPTDVFAAGVVLYELLSGQLSFPEEREPMAELYQRANGSARPLLDVAADVPPTVAAVVDRALAREVEDRFPTAEALGVAVAGATAAAYGASWLQRTGVPVLASTAVLAAAEGGTGRPLAVRRRTILTAPPQARLGAVEPFGSAPATAAPQGVPPVPPCATARSAAWPRRADAARRGPSAKRTLL